LSTGIHLIVGLGNPGAEYEHTRHNAGEWFVRSLADNANVTLRPTAKFRGSHAIATIKDHECHLLVPSTYMNLSGQAVQAVASFYKIPAEAILVAHDEIDLPVATLRLKFDGGAGGHNGLSDIISHLNTKKFYRLRIGVGHPGPRNNVSDYVLSPPKKSERVEINNALISAEGILPYVMKGEFQQAMQVLHSEKS
jgi:PTH1 family peptidyl-tRNA hydrolase